MADPDWQGALGYLAVVVVSQVVVGLGFWGQIAYQGAAMQFAIGITLAFELLTIYAAFQLYRLRHPT